MSEGIRRSLTKASRAKLCWWSFTATIVAGGLGLWWSGAVSGLACKILIGVAGVAAPLIVWVTEWIFEVDRNIPEPEREWD